MSKSPTPRADALRAMREARHEAWAKAAAASAKQEKTPLQKRMQAEAGPLPTQKKRGRPKKKGK